VCVCVKGKTKSKIHHNSLHQCIRKRLFHSLLLVEKLKADITYTIAIISNIRAQQTTTLTLTVSESLLTKCSMHYQCFVEFLLIFSLPVKNMADTHTYTNNLEQFMLCLLPIPQACKRPTLSTYPNTTACNIRLVMLPGQSSSYKIS
jgi:hypothetical protein